VSDEQDRSSGDRLSSSRRGTVIQDLSSDRDTIVNLFEIILSDQVDPEKAQDVFRRFFVEEAKARKELVVSGERETVDGIYYKAGQRIDAEEAARQAIEALVYGDELVLFALEPSIKTVSDFLLQNPDFSRQVANGEGAFSVSSLPGQIVRWTSKQSELFVQDDVDLVVGTAHLLAFEFGRALKILDPLAKRSSEPDVLVRAGDAALWIAQYSLALRHLTKARKLLRRSKQYDGRRMALLLSNIGACHDGLVDGVEVPSSGEGSGIIEQAKSLIFDVPLFGSMTAAATFREALEYLPEDSEQRFDGLARSLVLGNLGTSLVMLAASDPGQADAFREEARQYFEQALTMREELHDVEPNIAHLRLNLADLSDQQGFRQEARRHIKAAEVALQRSGQSHWLLARVRSFQAQYLFDEGEYASGLDLLDEARDVLIENGRERSEHILWIEYFYAHTLRALGDASSKRAMESLIGMAESILGDPQAPFLNMLHDEIDDWS
jgi:tetratricopeptide (TPR) repeat protein